MSNRCNGSVNENFTLILTYVAQVCIIPPCLLSFTEAIYMQTFLESPPKETINERESMSNKPRGFRLPAQIQKDLDDGQKACGANATELVIDCIQDALRRVVQRKLNERQRFAAQFMKEKQAA
jgi:hypothetical protein